MRESRATHLMKSTKPSLATVVAAFCYRHQQTRQRVLMTWKFFLESKPFQRSRPWCRPLSPTSIFLMIPVQYLLEHEYKEHRCRHRWLCAFFSYGSVVWISGCKVSPAVSSFGLLIQHAALSQFLRPCCGNLPP